MIADSGALKLQGACFTNQSKRRFLTEVCARVSVREEIVIQFTSIGCFYLYTEPITTIYGSQSTLYSFLLPLLWSFSYLYWEALQRAPCAGKVVSLCCAFNSYTSEIVQYFMSLYFNISFMFPEIGTTNFHPAQFYKASIQLLWFLFIFCMKLYKIATV